MTRNLPFKNIIIFSIFIFIIFISVFVMVFLNNYQSESVCARKDI
ncbi:hypothetical protein [Texas Phoenix palm phytoplasma]|nr:hypothetical protein [Texas Phoenix palm phytoplasma]